MPTGKNVAPLAPLTELKQNRPVYEPNKLTEALRQKYETYRKRDEQPWQEAIDIGKLVANSRSGKLLLVRNARNGAYLFVKKDGRFADHKTAGGLFQFYSTKLTAEWLSSRPERDPICPSDDDQIEQFISDVKIVQDHYDQKFFDDNYETQESLSAQDYGTWVTRFRFDPDKQDIVCELLDFPACRWDIRYRAEDSSYFLYESKCSTAKLKHILDAEIESDGDDGTHYGLQVVDQIARQGGNVSGEGKERPWGWAGNNDDETIVTEMWLQPDAYCDIELDKDEKTVSGQSLPKGQSLLEMFPNGLCAVGINGMKTLIGLYAENHKDHIVTGIYHLQSFSGVGKGISDAVDVKKEMDDLHSATLAYIKAHSFPATYYNQDLITEEQARDIGKPRKIIPVDFKNAPEGVNSINQAIQTITPSNPAQAAFVYKDTLNNWLQMAFQVTDFSNGLPGVDNKTATGARIGDSNAEMILVPQHRNKADHRKRSDVVIFNLFKKHVNKPKWFATNAKNGITAGKNISGTQFEGVDIDFQIVANSEVPQTPYQQRDAISQLLQFSGGLGGLLQSIQMNPEITGEIASAFGAKLSIPKQQDIARVCRKRIEQAKQILQRELMMTQLATAVGIQTDPSILPVKVVDQITPPISSFEMYAAQKAAWMAELLDADEMSYAPPELRLVLEEMITRQLEMDTLGQAKRGMDQNIGTVLANLPQIVGERYLSQQDKQMEMQYQQQQAQAQQQQAQQQAVQQGQQQLQLAGHQAAIQHQQAQTQHERALALQDDAHEKALQLKALDHLSAIDQAKNKPQPGAK